MSLCFILISSAKRMHTNSFTLHQNKNMKQQIVTKYEDEKRVQRLLAAIRCAVECAEATVFYAGNNRLLFGNHIVSKLALTTDNMHQWSQKIAALEQDIKANLLSLLYMYPPVINIRTLPNRFEVADMLYHIGYYPQREDYPFLQHPYADFIETFLSDEILLESYCAQAFQALIQTTYEGDWKQYGTRISDIYMAQPQTISSRLRMLLLEQSKAKSDNLCTKNAQI
jgi:hypothetical protein